MEHKDKNITPDTIAEQWVRLALAHLQVNKSAKKTDGKSQNKEQDEQ